MNIVSFSGGKDSTAMLLMMIEKNIKIDRVITVDTTKEFPEMYEHIDKIQKVCPVKIEVVKIDFDYFFSEYIKRKGLNIEEKGYGWASHKFRWCSGLKRVAFRSQLINHSYNSREWKSPQLSQCQDAQIYIGYSFDEKQRAKNDDKLKEKYPLIQWGITGKQALEYCIASGFDWGGLYNHLNRVSCWCCPLSRIGELEYLYNNYTDLWKQLTEMDKKTKRSFRKDYTIDELTKKFDFRNKNRSIDMFEPCPDC